MAVWKGTSSDFFSSSYVFSISGKPVWLSVSVSPCPGKCFMVETVFVSLKPSMNATPNLEAISGSSEKERTPITGLDGLVFISITGAKSRFMPSTFNSFPCTEAICFAAFTSPVAAKAMFPTPVVPNPRRLICPPSWSVAINKGMLLFFWFDFWRSLIRRYVCSASCRFSSKRITPPKWFFSRLCLISSFNSVIFVFSGHFPEAINAFASSVLKSCHLRKETSIICPTFSSNVILFMISFTLSEAWIDWISIVFKSFVFNSLVFISLVFELLSIMSLGFSELSILFGKTTMLLSG